MIRLILARCDRFTFSAGAKRLRHRGRAAGAMLVVGTVLLPACKDNRVALQDFIAIRDAQKPATPTVDPTRLQVVAAKKPFIVGPSDVLRITLRGLSDPLDSMTIEERINREGEVSLPLVGNVKIGGMELDEVETTITDRYVPRIVRTLSVHVDLISFFATEVVVTGAVTAPGLVPLQRNERDLLHAVAAAGGLSVEASGRVFLRRIRDPLEAETYDLLRPSTLQTALAIDPLESGDVILVEAAEPNTIYVGGLVNLPGPKIFPPGTEVNMLQALAASGGIREDLFPREATLIRRMPDGEDVQVRIDLNKLRNGEAPNIMLAAGDIFWVPETVGTRAMDWVNQNIFFRAGFTATYTVTGTATGIEFLNRRELQSTGIANQNQNGGGGIINPFGAFVPGN